MFIVLIVVAFFLPKSRRKSKEIQKVRILEAGNYPRNPKLRPEFSRLKAWLKLFVCSKMRVLNGNVELNQVECPRTV